MKGNGIPEPDRTEVFGYDSTGLLGYGALPSDRFVGVLTSSSHLKASMNELRRRSAHLFSIKYEDMWPDFLERKTYLQ